MTQAATENRSPIKALPGLIFVFILGVLSLQAFNLVFETIGRDVGALDQAALITAIPLVILGVVSVIYGSLGDYVSLRKLMLVGFVLIVIGSAIGLAFSFNIWGVVLARAIQTAGAQVAGSVFLVVTTKYADPAKKVLYFGIFTASYQLSTAIGVLAGGFIIEVDWVWLFAIPLLAVIAMPSILKHLPAAAEGKTRIDVAGFSIAAVMIGALVLFFNGMNLVWLGTFVVMVILFGIYINKAPNPFITPEFLRNRRFLLSTGLYVFYFGTYALTPLLTVAGIALFGQSAASMSLVLLAGYIAGTIGGTSSGAVVARIGRTAALTLAGGLMLAGPLLAAFTLDKGLIWIAISAVLAFGGMGTMYSPLVDTVLGTVDVTESGRGVGINDLLMNVSPSIGIALLGPLMSGTTMAFLGMPGVSAEAANFSGIFIVIAAAAAAGLIVFHGIRKQVYAKPYAPAPDLDDPQAAR